jgi:energy-coupling factor transporter ATP-binding protein EcfA2
MTPSGFVSATGPTPPSTGALPRSLLSEEPYPGLRPFHSDESDIFFGREDQTRALLKRLKRTRFLAVVGASGSGKSSLVRAGMIASVKAGFLSEPEAPFWACVEMRPGAKPRTTLARELLRQIPALRRQPAPGNTPVGSGDTPPVVADEFVEATLRRGPRGLIELFQQRPLPPGTSVLLLVDQFEEIFRLCYRQDPDEAEAFVAMLLGSVTSDEASEGDAAAEVKTGGPPDGSVASAANATPSEDSGDVARAPATPIHIVLTMRSDFLGDCALFHGLPEALNDSQFLTPRLTRNQLERAIIKPALVCGGDFSRDLVSRLFVDLAILESRVAAQCRAEAFTSAPAAQQNPEASVPTDTDILDGVSAIATLRLEQPAFDQLPILQHALQQMWHGAVAETVGKEEVDSDVVRLTLDLYDRPQNAEPGVAGTAMVPGTATVAATDYPFHLDRAMSWHADVVLESLSPEQRRIAEVMFRRLTESGGQSVRETRRPSSVQEIADVARVDWRAAAEVADAFRAPDSRFLMPSFEEVPQDELLPGMILDISHESLMRQWDTLVQWNRAEARLADLYRRVCDTACRWKDPEEAAALYQPPDLLRALAILYYVPGEAMPTDAIIKALLLTDAEKAEIDALATDAIIKFLLPPMQPSAAWAERYARKRPAASSWAERTSVAEAEWSVCLEFLTASAVAWKLDRDRAAEEQKWEERRKLEEVARNAEKLRIRQRNRLSIWFCVIAAGLLAFGLGAAYLAGDAIKHRDAANKDRRVAEVGLQKAKDQLDQLKAEAKLLENRVALLDKRQSATQYTLQDTRKSLHATEQKLNRANRRLSDAAKRELAARMGEKQAVLWLQSTNRRLKRATTAAEDAKRRADKSQKAAAKASSDLASVRTQLNNTREQLAAELQAQLKALSELPGEKQREEVLGYLVVGDRLLGSDPATAVAVYEKARAVYAGAKKPLGQGLTLVKITQAYASRVKGPTGDDRLPDRLARNQAAVNTSGEQAIDQFNSLLQDARVRKDKTAEIAALRLIGTAYDAMGAPWKKQRDAFYTEANNLEHPPVRKPQLPAGTSRQNPSGKRTHRDNGQGQ